MKVKACNRKESAAQANVIKTSRNVVARPKSEAVEAKTEAVPVLEFKARLIDTVIVT